MQRFCVGFGVLFRSKLLFDGQKGRLAADPWRQGRKRKHGRHCNATPESPAR